MLLSITVDSANSLAMKDPLDVGALSCQATRTCIHATTAWHSLVPTSQTRTAIGPPHDWLSCCQEQYGVSTFRLSEFIGLGAGSRPGSQMATRSHSGHDAPASSTFWSSAETTFACFCSRSLSPIHMCSPYQLSSTYPACGCQEGVPLAIYTPEGLASFVTLLEQLFIHAPRFTW